MPPCHENPSRLSIATPVDPLSQPLMPDNAPSPLLEPGRGELQGLVQHLHAHSLPWLPAGQGSRLHWGPPVPAATASVVSMRRLDRILEHNPGDFTITVEAGTPLVDVQTALGQHGQWLAVDPPWGTSGDGEPGSRQGAGSIGGLVARGLAGGYRQRHLGVRDQLIGIRLIRADGVMARAGGKVVKNVAGYDLMRLFTGSWGSLGLITEVTLRTLPLPPQRRGLWLQGPLAQLGELVRWLLGSSLCPERIDWWSAPLAASAGFEHQPLLLVGLASVNSTTLDEQIACLRARTPLFAHRLETMDLEALLAIARGGARTIGRGEAPCWLLRVGVPADEVEGLLAGDEMAGLRAELGAGSGIGMAWSSAQTDGDVPDALQIEALRRRCRRLGGFLTVLDQPPATHLPAWEDAPSRPLIETLKRRFDPRLQLAPGRLPGVAAPCLEGDGAQRSSRE